MPGIPMAVTSANAATTNLAPACSSIEGTLDGKEDCLGLLDLLRADGAKRCGDHLAQPLRSLAGYDVDEMHDIGMEGGNRLVLRPKQVAREARGSHALGHGNVHLFGKCSKWLGRENKKRK